MSADAVSDWDAYGDVRGFPFRDNEGLNDIHDDVTAPAPVPWVRTNMADRLRAAYAGEIEPVAFEVGAIPGGAAPIVYPGKVSGIAGDSGSGKSWIALAMALAEARTGGYTLWIDYEDTGDTLALRMMELGWPMELGRYVVHFQAVGPSSSGMTALVAAIRAHRVTLIVLDSTGESLASDGHNPSADEHVAAWFQDLPRPLANLGPAVVLIDHLVKDKDTGGLWPSGSHRKRDAINGIQYIVRTDKDFDRDTPGKVTLICAKDRGGHHAHGKRVVTIVFEPSGGVLNIIATPAGPVSAKSEWMPTGYMQKVSDYLAEYGPKSKNHLKTEARLGKSEYVLKGILALIEGGYAREGHHDGRPAVVLVKPFAEADDA